VLIERFQAPSCLIHGIGPGSSCSQQGFVNAFQGLKHQQVLMFPLKYMLDPWQRFSVEFGKNFHCVEKKNHPLQLKDTFQQIKHEYTKRGYYHLHYALIH
jgi:hypothetical protein